MHAQCVQPLQTDCVGACEGVRELGLEEDRRLHLPGDTWGTYWCTGPVSGTRHTDFDYPPTRLRGDDHHLRGVEEEVFVSHVARK